MPGSGVREVVGGTTNRNSNTGCRRLVCRNCNPYNITIIIRALASGHGHATNRVHRCFSGYNNGLNRSNSMVFVFSHGNVVIVRNRTLSRSAIVRSTLRTNTRSFRFSNRVFRVSATPGSLNTIHSTLSTGNCGFLSTRITCIPRAVDDVSSRSVITGVRGLVSVLRRGSSIRTM